VKVGRLVATILLLSVKTHQSAQCWRCLALMLGRLVLQGRGLFLQCLLCWHAVVCTSQVTNALQHLPSADNIIWMDNGRIRAQGK